MRYVFDFLDCYRTFVFRAYIIDSAFLNIGSCISQNSRVLSTLNLWFHSGTMHLVENNSTDNLVSKFQVECDRINNLRQLLFFFRKQSAILTRHVNTLDFNINIRLEKSQSAHYRTRLDAFSRRSNAFPFFTHSGHVSWKYAGTKGVNQDIFSRNLAFYFSTINMFFWVLSL